MLSGLITVLSPCILPILPILLSSGAGIGRSRSLGIITGLILSFSFFTLALTALVHTTGISPDILRTIAIGIIAFFGLTMLFPQLGDRVATFFSGIGRLGSSLQTKSSSVGTGFLSGFILGIALGLIWTPCAGPILASITALVATSAITWNAIAITLAYSLGAAIPMFIISYGGSKILYSTQFLAKYSEIIRKIFGALMIMSALAIAFHWDVVLQQFAVRYFPILSVENNEIVKNELQKIYPINSTTPTPGTKAPDLIGITQWFNSSPLSLEQLRGKVVLIDFWTYSCINCVRTLPYLKAWYDKYKNKNFVLIGVHTPEFEFEKSEANVQNALKRFNITYPVAMDNNYKTWRNYNNHYWPAHYLIDQNGFIKKQHFGEGGYEETENTIRTLLGLIPLQEEIAKETTKITTPEIYLGYTRAQNYQPEISIKKDQSSLYNYTHALANDHVGLKGEWLITPEFIQSESDDALLELNFIGTHVYLVMKSPTPQRLIILLDGKPVPPEYYTTDMDNQGQIQIIEPRMYALLNLKENHGRHTLTLYVPKGISAYAFTFG